MLDNVVVLKFCLPCPSRGYAGVCYFDTSTVFLTNEMVYNGNLTEWSAIWSEIIRVISKSNQRAERVRFEITFLQ